MTDRSLVGGVCPEQIRNDMGRTGSLARQVLQGATRAMRPYYTGHPVATALFAGTLVIWLATEGRQALKRRPEATTRDYGSRLVLALCAIGGFGLAALARDNVTAAAFPTGAITFGVGLAIVWAGAGLRWWSFRTLGRYFTIDVMTSSDQPVITSGPYRVLRHPSYTGLLLVLAGIGVMMYANWLSLVAIVLLSLVGLMNRIRVEEAALAAALGEAYTSYAARRKRIVPFVW